VSAPWAVPLTEADLVVAERIMQARIAAKLTPSELALAADLDYRVVGLIEDATRAATPAEVAALAGALGMSTAELVGAVPAC
jgi:hypothetical protein